MEKQILTPDHPAWPEYLDKLSFAVNAHAEFSSENNCNGDLEITKRVLSNLKGIDVEDSLAFIKAKYGPCDCRVLKIAS